MTKKLEELLAQLPPDLVEEAEREAAKQRPLIEAMIALQELRKLRGLQQQDLAEAMGVKQAAVSRLERRTDMYVSTLKELIAAMGGELHLVAEFPEGTFELNQFSDLGKVAELVSA